MLQELVADLGALNDFAYLYVLVALLVAAGVVLTIWTRGVQVRHFGHMARTVLSSRKGADGGISSFQAFAIGMATRVGIGNITGVALALVLGGPGAIFWMWMISLVGMATSFAEASLAQLFKQPAGDRTFRGGPAWYITHGLRSRALGVLFAVLLLLSMVIPMPMVQANSIAVVARELLPGAALDLGGVQIDLLGVLLAVLVVVVIFGGVRSVARVSEWLVPLMALAYVAMALVVVLMNITVFPQFLADIVGGAFGLREGMAGIAGGVLAALLNGARRGLFSNEAGMGTNPNAAATATVAHPAQQGFIQAFGVFVDTWFVCTATAFIILSAGPSVFVPGTTEAEASGTLTTVALAEQLGPWVPWLMVVIVFCFGFSSILGAYAYAEANIVFLGDKPWMHLAAKISATVCTYIGAVAALHTVWILMDTAMALITVVNLIALLALGRHVAAILKDWERQYRAGNHNPTFIAANAQLPEGTLTTWWKTPESSSPQQ